MATEIKSFKVDGMTCSHCENTVKKAVGSLNGVMNVNVNLKEKKVMVEFEPEKVEVETIKAVIEDQGYDVK